MDIKKVPIRFIQKGYEDVKGFFNFETRCTTFSKDSPVRAVKCDSAGTKLVKIRTDLEDKGVIVGDDKKKYFNEDYTVKPVKKTGTSLSPAASIVLYRDGQGTTEIQLCVDNDWLGFYAAQKRLGLGPKWEDYKTYCEQTGVSKNGARNYAAWLNNVEDKLGVSLENEYARDNCEQIKAYLKDANKLQEKGIQDNAAQNYRSAIQKFIEFKSGQQELSSDNVNDKRREGGEPHNNDEDKQVCPLNQILYGPPGTGKTHNSVIYAYAICEGGDVEQLKETCKKKEEYDKVFKKYKELQKQGRIEFITFHQSYGYEEFIRGIKPIVIGKDDERKVIYEVEDGVFKKFCDEAKKEENKGKNYVFIIDEINRGNVSKIFGELITLIEESKRIGAEEEMQVRLPYRDELFGVPKNVYILGTMNTADRSLVQLDAALRRRFRFEEMMPKPELLPDDNKKDNPIGVDLQKLLSAINERICALIDREHQIGHSYLMKVKTLQDLQETFQYEIIPLLQEYFYEDYESILKVLNNQLIQVAPKKFGGVDYKTYTINAKGANPKDFKAIYGGDTSDTENAENTEPQE